MTRSAAWVGSCCGPAGTRGAKPSATMQDLSPTIRDTPPIIWPDGGASYVGTDRPVIPEYRVGPRRPAR